MPRLLKYIGYVAIFIVSYAIFLYWVFPYSALKDRVLGEIERQIGGGVTVSAKSFEPYWISGIDVEDLSIEAPGPSGTVPLLKIKRARARAALIPLIFGSKRISFDVEPAKGEISGFVKVSDESLWIELELDDLDISAFPFIRERTGLSIPTNISGEVKLDVNRAQLMRTTGDISLALNDIKIAASSLKIGDAALDVPELVLAKGKESRIKISVGKGTAALDQFTFAGGDLGLDVKGKVFLSAKPENYRLNLKGSFTASPKLGEALPFLFIVDSQKQEDGSYPLLITGRLGKPSIKIGTFTLPM